MTKELEQALQKVWADGRQWAYPFCDYELLCMYDEDNIIKNYSEKQVIQKSRKLGHAVVEFEGITYFSAVELSEDTLLEVCKEAERVGDL